MINKTVAILAGGQSSRMNYNDKALLTYNEQSFIEHIIKSAGNFKEVIIISNKKDLYERFNLKVFEDIYIGNGALSGIHSALKNSSTDEVLCIACDMPLIKSDVIEYMGNYKGNYEVLVPKYNDKLQPLCAIYTKAIEERLERNLINNKNKVQRFIMSLQFEVLESIKNREFDDEDFMNVNTVAEYEALKRKNVKYITNNKVTQN